MGGGCGLERANEVVEEGILPTLHTETVDGTSYINGVLRYLSIIVEHCSVIYKI